MKREEIEILLSNICDWDRRDLKWQLLTNDYERHGAIKIYHIVQFNFMDFIDKMDKVASLKAGEHWSNLFSEDRRMCEDRVKLSICTMKSSVQFTDLVSENEEVIVTNLFYIFLNHINRFSNDTVERLNRNKTPNHAT